MTQKELLYVEDAVSHEDIMIKVLNESISKLEDQNLVSFMQNEVNIHTDMKENLMNLLEDKVNE